jgi:hypothetical protein
MILSTTMEDDSGIMRAVIVRVHSTNKPGSAMTTMTTTIVDKGGTRVRIVALSGRVCPVSRTTDVQGARAYVDYIYIDGK